MAGKRDVRAIALKRAQDAERSAMVLEQENEAKAAEKAEYSAYISYLEANESLSEPQRRLLAHLSLSGMPHRACYRAGIPPRTYYDWIAANPEFKAMVAETKQYANDRLEQVAIDLATGAYMKPLVSQGRVAAYERIYDTKALITLLKSRKPKEFSERIDVTSNGHSLVKLIDKEAWDSV